MNVLEAINARKSYRGKFKPAPIPRKELEEILEAGTAAPSGCNLQTARFIAVDEPEKVKALAEIYGHGWAATAPAAILILSRYTMSPSGVSYHIHDYSAAAENILLAVTAKGYATTWIEGQIRGEGAKRMGELLGVPEEFQVVIYLPLGIPAEPFKAVRKLPFESRAWFNCFGTETERGKAGAAGANGTGEQRGGAAAGRTEGAPCGTDAGQARDEEEAEVSFTK